MGKRIQPAQVGSNAGLGRLVKQLRARTDPPPCNPDGTYTIGNCPPDKLCHQAADAIERLALRLQAAEMCSERADVDAAENMLRRIREVGELRPNV